MKLAQIKVLIVLALSFFEKEVNKPAVRKVARQFWQGLDDLFAFSAEDEVERN